MSKPKLDAKEIAIRIALPIISIVVCLLLAELALRLASPLMNPRFTRVDADVGWYHYPSVRGRLNKEDHEYEISYNSHGYRPPEHSYEKPAGILRVVFLGDSFTDGAEVADDELFTWLLQNELDGVEVINLGVYGYSTAQELITLEQRALRYDPDLVILFSMTNDFGDNMRMIGDFGPTPRFVLEGDSLVLQRTDHPDIQGAFRETNLRMPGMGWLHRHSYLYYLLNKEIYQKRNAEKILDTVRAQKNSKDPAYRLELYRRMVHRMRDFCDRNGVDFWVAFAYGRRDMAAQDLMPREAARSLAADGLTVLDLFEPLQQAQTQAEGSLYYKQDMHWNTTGHRFVADFFAPHMKRWQTAVSASRE